eukprot:TRINITY_DN17253_c0_g2_i4.p2 TRINITY_DN17253_c0_g2~~TRINITY_DN17253_c0_g2_i4.p2  ORF type:complete len:102 (-),score=11.30 TRINITY_DN17253_c0_g2_i4:73-378(-)
MVANVFGGWSAQAIKVFSGVAAMVASRTGDVRGVTFAYFIQGLSIVFQRSTASMFLRILAKLDQYVDCEDEFIVGQFEYNRRWLEVGCVGIWFCWTIVVVI